MQCPAMQLTLVTSGYETSIECLPQDAVVGRLNCIGPMPCCKEQGMEKESD
jgi:hypothetical protein